MARAIDERVERLAICLTEHVGTVKGLRVEWGQLSKRGQAVMKRAARRMLGAEKEPERE